MKFIGCRDMVNDKFYSFVNRHYKKIVWSVTLLACVIAPSFGFVLVLAMLLSFHQASTVNVVCHNSKYGYRNFNTKDSSNNIKSLSFVTFGQALHNNHHANPGSHNYAVMPSEYDVGLLLSKLIGLKPRKLA
jgi:stearoyl-CoA desaturase (delta-9 desaturase)